MTASCARTPPRNIQRDQKTMAAMVCIYCADRHGSTGPPLCEACAALLDYGNDRLD